MSEDASTPNAPDEAPPGAISAKPKVPYAGGASLIDVMIDQFEYLLDHASPQCGPECADCQRLEQVKHWLLAPFDSDTSG